MAFPIANQILGPAAVAAILNREPGPYSHLLDQVIEPQSMAIYLTKRFIERPDDLDNKMGSRDPDVAMSFAKLINEGDIPPEYSQTARLVRFSIQN
jgi:hypothetical protein